ALEHLAFGGNKMSGAALPLLKALPALKELRLSGQQRTDSGLWSVALTDFNVRHLAALSQLEVLDLGETTLTDRGAAELATLKNLHTLDLHGTRITSKGLATIATLPKLRHLKLWKAKGIDDAAIPIFQQMHELQALEIPETNITFVGLKDLANKPNHKLEHLFLGGLDLTSEQLDELRQLMPSCCITWWQKPAIEYPETGRRSGN